MGSGKEIGKESGRGFGIEAGVGSDKELDKEEDTGIVELERIFDNEEVVVIDEDTGIWLDWWDTVGRVD